MKILNRDDIDKAEGELYSHKVGNLRTQLEAESTCNFFIMHGVKYDSKTDRYVAHFETPQGAGTRKFDVKCSTEAAQFFLANCERRGSWYLKLEDGIIVDVTLFDYN